MLIRIASQTHLNTIPASERKASATIHGFGLFWYPLFLSVPRVLQFSCYAREYVYGPLKECTVAGSAGVQRARQWCVRVVQVQLEVRGCMSEVCMFALTSAERGA